MNYYVTSPIYYVNDLPHIGHAYTTIICDIIARYYRLNEFDVTFMTGTDEHGQKIQRSAENAGKTSQEFVDQVSIKFHNLADLLETSYDIFLRTSEQRHKDMVLQIWQKLIDNGNIYLGKYAGWYSIRDEAFYEESELDDNKLAPTGSPVEWVEEPCYFFALSKWQQPLLDFYSAHKDFVKPGYRLNEVVSFVQSGLRDLAVSRTGVSWGIKVPGDQNHVIYVWLDALTSYLSASACLSEKDQQAIWPADVHVVGKDILRFHAVYWPAFLMALGMELPKHIIAHGWWTNEGQKISKSLGNVIDPVALIEEFGLDPVRYFLVREISFGSDGNFVRDNLISRVNSELNNKIGNLSQRVLSFIYKQVAGPLIIESIDSIYQNDELVLKAAKLPDIFSGHMQDFAIHLALDAVISLADEANKYVDVNAPWKLIKSDVTKAHEVLFALVEAIRYIGIALQPFIPSSAAKILDQLQVPLQHRNFSNLTKDFALRSFAMSSEPKPIFVRLSDAG
jgi:methionyl-tRNA synthetase